MRGEKETILNEILRLLGEKYPIGLYEYLFKHRREAYNELLQLESRVDNAYLSGTVDDLKSVLRDYWTFHIKAIKKFRESEQPDLNLDRAREEMSEDRIRA